MPNRDEGTNFNILVNGATGDDVLNDGLTLATPKKTIQAGIDAVPQGGMVRVRNVDGTTKYREIVSAIGKGGTDSNNKTTVAGYGTEKPHNSRSRNASGRGAL